MASESRNIFLGDEDPDAVTVIRTLTEGVVTFSLPHVWPAKLGRIHFGARCTALRMASGDITILSPTPLTRRVQEAVTSLGGTVKYVGLLNNLHHVYADEWAAAYPNAQFVGVEGLTEQRKEAGYGDLRMPFVFRTLHDEEKGDSAIVPADLPEDFTSEFDTEYMTGHLNKELVFFHRPSRTMVQADLLFNLPPREQYSKSAIDPAKGGVANRVSHWSWGGKVVAAGRFLNKDDKAWRRSVQRMADEWDMQQVVACHGDVIDRDANEVFRKAFAKSLA